MTPVTQPTVTQHECERTHGWLDRLQPRDREHADAVAEWLQPIPWQLYASLTFPWQATAATAQTKLHELVNNLERQMRTTVGCVAGLEQHTKSGQPVPAHLHAALTSLAPLDAGMVAHTWRTLIGTAHRSSCDSADIRPFDPGMPGVAYALKGVGAGGDWFAIHLKPFLPRPAAQQSDHRALRAERRFAKQQAIYCQRTAIC